MKMYNKPATEVMDLKTASLMAGVTVSPGSVTDPSTPPPLQAPPRGELLD